jgi:cell division protein FtsB
MPARGLHFEQAIDLTEVYDSLGSPRATLAGTGPPRESHCCFELTGDSGEATLRAMVRPAPTVPSGAPHPDAPDPAPSPEEISIASRPSLAAGASIASLADLPVAGLTRRRIAILMGAILAAWVILLFARQVGEVGEATAQAAAMRAENARLGQEAAALESELALIQRQDYIEQAARAYRLGHPKEIPFTLDENALPLPPDAPGSAAVRLGTEVVHVTPLEAWARLLLGAGDPGPADAPEMPGTN